jgi:type II secretory ATPase GspE/PulE/Tfp pilus assembly ATPase PilB-like protein
MAVSRSTVATAMGAVASPDIGAPAVRAVDASLRRAIASRASDVHVEPIPDGGGRIRVRVDGLLCAHDAISPDLYAPFVSRIKLLAEMDIANRRTPQDGRYSFAYDGRTIDARVSSIPVMDGEKLVIRLLDHQLTFPKLDELGMSTRLLETYRAVNRAPWGFVVVSGPTGSGKTTTLYASLADLDRRDRNICTVEDPIEARLSGVAQVQVNLRAGLSFPVVLRSLMRQDPDVIMIGEMRDEETVSVGIAAALAGQTVFATVHSNDAARTLDRLVELGVTRHSLAAGLTAVVAQRLVRRLCRECRRGEPLPAMLRADEHFLGSTICYVASGCACCNGTGYDGRIGVFELLRIDDELRDMIARGTSSAALRQFATEHGHRSLHHDAASKIADGTTSFDEIDRVVGWWVR